MALDLNPFIYDRPVEPEELIDREEEAARLLRMAEEGRTVRLSAPRRYGKTSLIKRLQADSDRQAGMPSVYVDFSSVASLPEVAVRLEEAYRKSLQGPVARTVVAAIRALRPRLRAGVPGSGFEVQPTIAEDTERLLGGLLELPKRVFERTGARTLIVFDEFQDVLSAQERVDGLIRSHIQHHTTEASYLFAGSHPGLMLELFGDAKRKRPFWDQATPVELGRLKDEDLADYVGRRFESSRRDPGRALEPLLDLAQGHPQRAMLLAYHLWEATSEGDAADEETWEVARETALSHLREPFELVWRERSVSQRRVLTAVAGSPDPLLSERTLDRIGVAKSTAREAREQLIWLGDLETRDKALAFVDPLFEVWVRDERGAGAG